MNAELNDTTRQMHKLRQKRWTPEEIGDKFGLTRQGVRYRLTKHLRRSVGSRFIYQGIDEAELIKLSVDQNLSDEKVAKLLKISPYAVGRALQYHNISAPPQRKKGGYIVDFLRSLEINESKPFKLRTGRYPFIYDNAKRIGIKISIKTVFKGEYLITRIK
jgi:biotin operon repressor